MTSHPHTLPRLTLRVFQRTAEAKLSPVNGLSNISAAWLDPVLETGKTVCGFRLFVVSVELIRCFSMNFSPKAARVLTSVIFSLSFALLDSKNLLIQLSATTKPEELN